MMSPKLSLSKGDKPADDTPKKQPYNFQDFVNSFNSLDPQNMGNWPLPVKLTVYLFVMLATLALAYFLLINPVMVSIEGARAQETTLLAEYRDKDSKLRNLKLYQVQITQMEETFGQLLRQLPKETEIPGLVEDINYTGVGSGVQFGKIEVKAEQPKEFFVELPIQITGQGDFHSFGGFVSGLAALPRIVTLHDFTIKPIQQKDSSRNDVPVLVMTIQAKTYRYNDKSDTANADKTASGAKPEEAKP